MDIKILKLSPWLLLCSLYVNSCAKRGFNSLEGIENLNALVYYNNGEYVDNGYIGDYDVYLCNQTCECPYVLGGQTYPNLCKVSYTFTLYDNFAGYDVLLQYSTVDSLEHFAVDSLSGGLPAYYHKDQSSLYALFAPQQVAFAAHPDSLGSYISFTKRKNGKQYTSIPTTSIAINNDPRFYFRFMDSTRVTTYGERDGHAPPLKRVTYKISARGQFAAVLYAAVGDSINITNGEFRLPFCE
jgi:hypothetical protein